MFNSYTQEKIKVFKDFSNPIVDVLWFKFDKKFYITTKGGIVKLIEFIPKDFKETLIKN